MPFVMPYIYYSLLKAQSMQNANKIEKVFLYVYVFRIA